MTRARKIEIGFCIVLTGVVAVSACLAARRVGFANTAAFGALGVCYNEISLTIAGAVAWHWSNSFRHRKAVERLREQGYL